MRRIVVVRPNRRLGNTLMLTPLVQELQERFPGAQIELITTCAAAATLFEGFPQVTAVHAIRTEQPLRALGRLLSLQRRSYDLAIDPNLHSRTGRALLGYVRARDRVGFRWGVAGRDRMLTHAGDPQRAPLHVAQSPLFLLHSAYYPQALRLADAAIEAGRFDLPLELRLTPSERLDGERRLAEALASADGHGRPRVGIYAHATGLKSYPAGWWGEVIDQLRRRSPAIQLLEIVPQDGRARLAGVIPGLYTPDLRLLGATLAAASLVVIPDGGVMHLAEAAGARLLALFRNTEPARYGPYRPGSEAIWARDPSPESVAARILALLDRTSGVATG